MKNLRLLAASTAVSALAVSGGAASVASASATPAPVASVAATNPAAVKRARLAVTVKPSATRARVKQKITVTGTVRPARSAKAALQVYSGGKWHNIVRNIPVTKDGRYAGKIWATGRGRFTVRAFGYAGKRTGASKAFVLRVR